MNDALIAAYDEYIKLLAESEVGLMSLASLHGYKCPDKLVERGKELRARIASLKAETPDWKVGNWVIYNLSVGQIKELRDHQNATFTDGSFETSGRLTERFRPLTLRNKSIVEDFDIYYHRLYEIDGHAGFNFPDIHAYFSLLALNAIDNTDLPPEKSTNEPQEKAQQFVMDAKLYKGIIQGVRLFRPNLRAIERGRIVLP